MSDYHSGTIWCNVPHGPCLPTQWHAHWCTGRKQYIPHIILDARLPTHIFWVCFRWFNWRVALLSQCCEKYKFCPATPFHDAVKNTISARPRHFMMLWKIQFLPGHAISWCCEKHNFCPATPFHDAVKNTISARPRHFMMVRKHQYCTAAPFSQWLENMNAGCWKLETRHFIMVWKCIFLAPG
jgi:hypothetical protein